MSESESEMKITEKVRVPNLTTSEKFHLLRIIANSYASIIEDKETDRASVQKKDTAWKEITLHFNASSSGIARSMISLKKCCENRKKQLRKTLANKKWEVTLTGGGLPPKIKKDDTDEILVCIVNKKTLVGFQNNFDNDAEERIILCKNPDESNEVEFEVIAECSAEYFSPQQNTPIYIDETDHLADNSTGAGALEDNVNWKKYNPSTLQNSINPALRKKCMTSRDNLEQDVPAVVNSKLTPSKPTSSSRRRPTAVIKTLASSELANKYNILLDQRLMLIEGQISHMNHENLLIIRKRELEILEMELSLKKKSCKSSVE